MQIARFKLFALALLGGVSLAGCASEMYGPYGYGPYGGMSVGVGYGGYYGYGYGYPYGYGYDPFGWYGDFYYPGTGIYVYDRDRHRHEWNDDQRRYWENRRSSWQSRTGRSWSGHSNWSGWHRGSGSTSGATTTSGTTSGGHWQHPPH